MTDWNRSFFSTILRNKTDIPSSYIGVDCVILVQCLFGSFYQDHWLTATEEQRGVQPMGHRWLTGIIGGDAAGSLMPGHHLLLPGGGVWGWVGGYPGCVSGSCLPDLHAAPGLRHGGHAGGGLCGDGVHRGWWGALLTLRTLRAGATGLVGRLQRWGREAQRWPAWSSARGHCQWMAVETVGRIMVYCVKWIINKKLFLFFADNSSSLTWEARR